MTGKYLIFCLSFIFSIVLYSCKNSDNNKNLNIENDSTLTIEKLNQQIRKYPENPELFVKRGELQLADNNSKDAIRDFEIALKLDSTKQDLYLKLSDLYLQNADSKKAYDILLKCLNIYPANVEARIKLAYLYFYLELYRDAMQQIITLEENNLQNADSYFLKGLILKETEDYDNAITAFKKSLEFNNKNDQAYILLGLIYTKQKNELAFEYFKTASNLFPNNAEVFFNQGYALQEFGKYQQAKDSYLKATELDSTYYEAFYNLGYLNVNFLNNYEEAVKYFTKAIELKPNSDMALYNRGFVYEKMGKYKLAEKDYRKVLELYPNHDLAVAGLNEVIDKQNKY